MKSIAALVLLLALSACSLPVFFRVPIVQGNIVTAAQVTKLKIGMTKKQVAYILGTPLIKSPFESNRWDYVFYYRNPNAHVRETKLDLYFADGRLTHIEGNKEYTSQQLESGNQSNAGRVPLPGEAGSIQSPTGAGQSGGPPTNASGSIPHSNTSRPGTGNASPPAGPANRPAPIPNNGPALPAPNR